MPRCKNCKEKYEAKHFNQKYCFKSECVKVWVSTSKVKNWKKEKKQLKDELETIQQKVLKVQKIVNKYVRLRDEGKECISCSKKLKGKYDAGHYYSAGTHWSVRFHLDNIWGQCVHCNRDRHGNLIEYRIKLLQRIGQDRLTSLQDQAHHTRKFTKHELEEISKKFKQMIKEIIDSKNR